jgi:putative membrane protein
MDIVLRRLAIALIISATGISAHAQGTTVTVQQFAARSYELIRFDIKLSQLASNATKNNLIIEVAGRIIESNGKMLKDLVKAATASDIKLRAGMSEEHRTALSMLRPKKDEDFDRMYIQEQLKAHDDAVALFSSYAQNGREGSLKAFAAENLPALERRRDRLKSLASEVQ